MDFKADLESIIKKSFEILRSESSGTRLIFPKYSDGAKKRVSEQELRFVFVEQLQPLLEKYDYYYSVETPTEDKYKFSDQRIKCKPVRVGDGQSASFDLTIKAPTGANIAIIEFKAKSASPHEYAKDLCKLWNPNEKSEYRYFINLFEKIEERTKNVFLDKIENREGANDYLPRMESKEKVYIWAESLRDNDEVIQISL